MNTYDYRIKVIMSIEEYLEGFIIKNKDNKTITADDRIKFLLKHFTPEISEMFYEKTLYRTELDKFITKIRVAYENLKATELEFSTTNEEIDAAIAVFEKELKKIILEFQEGVYEVIKGKEGYQTSAIRNYLGDIKIKIVNDEIAPEPGLTKPKDVVPALYIMHNWIQDKCEKLFEYKTFAETTYQIGTPEYLKAKQNYINLFNKKDYEKFINLYNEVYDEMTPKIIK